MRGSSALHPPGQLDAPSPPRSTTLGAPVVLLVGPQLIAYRGFWLDYQWKLRWISRYLLTCLAPLESRARSSQPLFAQMSTNSCSGPAGGVFPAAYRATDVRSPGCGSRRVCQQSETLVSVVTTALWSVCGGSSGVPLFSCGRLRARLPSVRLSLEAFHRVRRHRAIPCEVWQRGSCDMQVTKTGKSHSTFLVQWLACCGAPKPVSVLRRLCTVRTSGYPVCTGISLSARSSASTSSRRASTLYGQGRDERNSAASLVFLNTSSVGGTQSTLSRIQSRSGPKASSLSVHSPSMSVQT